MNTSETISKIAPALVKAQQGITFAVKDSVNPQFKSKYADLGAVIDALKPALNGAGISFIQMLAPGEPGSIALTTRLIHESGEWIESTATCPLVKHDPQGYGSACSYLRRYSLAAAVGLYQDDDDGNAAVTKTAKGVPMVAPEKRTPSVAQTVLDQSEAIPAARKTELAVMANKIAQAMLSKGASWCHDRLAEEDLDDLELIYLSSLLTPANRNALKAESIARANAAREVEA